ncbi:glycosyltransferase [Caldichromatium japonicum]|uniref:Glycosyltransferase n=1 Tax=Caldichromatium japonicum TaxID=2699430 RepID=A0A6G7V9R9_9GAMM|nr:glycosyltransferase [Caldichromatium japonicum]QIK36702.1 glycosyltransferase [Caldichromatium japonicum]
MRIACFFATSGHSGVDRLARHLLPALARRGYQVDLLKIRNHGPELAADTPGLRVLDLGVRHTLTALPGLIAYLKRAQPDVLLTDKDRVNRLALAARTIASVSTRLILRIGTTVSVDLASRNRLECWVQRRSIRFLYPLADRVLVPSQGAADDLACYTGLDRRHIQAVPSPIVPASLFENTLPPPDHPWFAPGEPPVILGLGELCARKDFATLIRAFARVRAQRPCRLMILGRGRQRERLLMLTAELGMSRDVEFPGFVPGPYAYLDHARLFVLSSRWEGLPFALVEALAVGTPAVATDCPSGPREVLEGGRYGRLVPVGDDCALAEAIDATLDAPLPRAVLQQTARRFEIESATSAYLEAMGLPERL